MKHFFTYIFIAIAITSFGQNKHLPNTIVVKFAYNYSKNHSLNTKLSKLKQVVPDITAMQEFYPAFNMRNDTIPEKLDLSCIYKIKIQTEKDLAGKLEKLNKLEYICYAELYYLPKLLEVTNDPFINSQYHLPLIQAFDAFDLTHGDTNIVIGISDTGVDFLHEDLTENIKYNSNDPINGIDDDNDMFIDNLRGWDFAENDNNPQFLKSDHGVKVTGIIAASTNNEIGISGVGYTIKYLPIKIMDDTYGYLSGVYESILYAVEQGCQIVNCSWGGTYPTNLGQDVIDYAIYQNCLVVAAAGNDKNDVPFYPASYNGVVSVAATNAADEVWIDAYSGSSYGIYVDICAPGQNIYSTKKNNTYGTGSGTSYAAPIVSGVAGLVKSLHPEYTAEQLAEQLRISADVIDTSYENQFYYRKIGYGRVNALNALTKTNYPSVRIKDLYFSTNTNPGLLAGDTLTVSFSAVNILAQTTNTTLRLITNSDYITPISNHATIGALAPNETYTNSENPFLFKINPELPANSEILFTFEMQDQGYNDYQQFKQIIHRSYINVSNTVIGTTLSSNGKIGYHNRTKNIGNGLIYNGENRLYEAGIILANSTDHVSSTLFGKLDFKTLNIVDTTTKNSVLNGYNTFMPNAETTGLNVAITQKTELFMNDDLANTLLYTFYIKNQENYNLNDIRLALFTIWNFDGPTKAEYNDEYQLFYTACTANTSMYGAILMPCETQAMPYGFDLTEDGNGGIAIVKDLNYDYPDSFDYPDQLKWFTMTNPRPVAGQGDTLSVATQLTSGGHTIAAGDSAKITFALIIAQNYLQITETAQKITDYYNHVAVKSKAKLNLDLVYPNPASNKIYITLDDTQEIQISIFSITGKRILQTASKQINISAIPNGIYMINISHGQKNYYNKLVVFR